MTTDTRARWLIDRRRSVMRGLVSARREAAVLPLREASRVLASALAEAAAIQHEAKDIYKRNPCGDSASGFEIDNDCAKGSGETTKKSSHVSKARKFLRKVLQNKGRSPANHDLMPARREGIGKDARLVFADGKPVGPHVHVAKVLEKWTNVRVTKNPESAVLAKGVDEKGRTQTVYSDKHNMKMAAAKFARTKELISKWDAIFRQNQDNRKSTDPLVRENADCTYLIQQQGTRPGSARDTRAEVQAYGATTLRAEHVTKKGNDVILSFIGKKGVQQNHIINDKELANMLVRRKKTAGTRGGKLFSTDEKKLNSYIDTLNGGKFSAKDFRTGKATLIAVSEVRKLPKPTSKSSYKKQVMNVAKKVSSVLGNRPAQALKSYINPAVFSAWSV